MTSPQSEQDSIDEALSARDLSFVRSVLPSVSAFVRRYFRAEVEGFENVPDGPALFVGTHSGGNGSPDSIVFILSFLERYGLDRPLYWLGHSLIMQLPFAGRFLARCGVLSASPDIAVAALARGSCVVVYPGGDVELHRPFWERNRVSFRGHQGFLRIAVRAGVPIVPVVASGGHRTYLPLASGTRVAHALGLDRRLRLKVVPVSIAAPWGLNVGDFLGHLPLPAKIRVRLLEPIDVAERFGTDLDAAYESVTAIMQQALDDLVESEG